MLPKEVRTAGSKNNDNLSSYLPCHCFAWLVLLLSVLHVSLLC